MAQRLGLSKPTLDQYWLTVEDLDNLLHLADFEVIKHSQEILCPVPLPLAIYFYQSHLGQTLAIFSGGSDKFCDCSAEKIAEEYDQCLVAWLLSQPIKDTLCGSKVLWKKDYELIAANRAYFGDFDPFGDFDLLFGAAKLNLKICEIPIRYRERTYGTTNIERWKHAWLLLKMVLFAARRIKFV